MLGCLAYDKEGIEEGVTSSFANDWQGEGSGCSIGKESCGLPQDCIDYRRKEGSGRAHVIMKSLDNLHRFYHAQYNALKLSSTDFGILQKAFQRYYPEIDLEDEALVQIIGLGTSLLGMGGGLAGSETVGVVSDAITLPVEQMGEAMKAEPADLTRATQL